MNKIILLLSLLFLTTCSKNDTINNCNYLLDLGVNEGNGGIIVTNVGTGLRAWDAADPNHTPSTCSIMQINGVNAKCGCSDGNEYSLFTGGPIGVQLPCGMKEYRVSPNGSNSYLITN